VRQGAGRRDRCGRQCRVRSIIKELVKNNTNTLS
jgi:hypothetical protein